MINPDKYGWDRVTGRLRKFTDEENRISAILESNNGFLSSRYPDWRRPVQYHCRPEENTRIVTDLMFENMSDEISWGMELGIVFAPPIETTIGVSE